jgi:hypothetical protein
MGYVFNHHGEQRVHKAFSKVFSMFSVVKWLGKPTQLSTLLIVLRTACSGSVLYFSLSPEPCRSKEQWTGKVSCGST